MSNPASIRRLDAATGRARVHMLHSCHSPFANAVEIVNRDMPSDYFRLSREQGGTQGGCIVQLTRQDFSMSLRASRGR